MEKHSKESAVPNKHWEFLYSTNPPQSNTPAGAFVPKQSKNRPQPHVKVNETDH